MSRTGNGLLAAAVSLVATAVGSVGVGIAAPLVATAAADKGVPKVTLNRPESPSSNTTPSFTGTASDTTPVTVQIHAGTTAKGTLVSLATAPGTGAGWTSGPASPALSSGVYTADATQTSSPGNHTGSSKPVTFTVVAPPVGVPIAPPVTLFTATPFPVAAPASLAAAPAVPPVASFKWFPPAPQTGELVSLVSTSIDTRSPITGFAWSLTSSSPFLAGGALLTTSFSTRGGHVVRLRVTDADGLSSLATETINVGTPRAFLMRPFPVVRIAGTETASGVKLRLLEVQQLPVGALITARCKGRACPTKSTSRVTVSANRRVASIELRRFERFLRFGVTLEIRISKPGEIGKYTRFAIRRGKLPERVDMCLDQAGVKPLVCPSS
jgi:Bacterial Ig-like domain